MIKKCIVLSEDGFHRYRGTYVNGGVVYEARGLRYNCKYDKKRHTIIDDYAFDKQMDVYKRFLEVVDSKFAKSVVWREQLCVRLLFHNEETYNLHIQFMLKLNILCRDGRYLTQGEKP